MSYRLTVSVSDEALIWIVVYMIPASLILIEPDADGETVFFVSKVVVQKVELKHSEPKQLQN